MGREEGWVLNLVGRDGVMNINFFLFFFILKRICRLHGHHVSCFVFIINV